MSFENRVLDTFTQLCAIPHCSFHTQGMFEYLIQNLKRLGYTIKTDEAHNILATKGNPKICLQSHYDMVCVGESDKGMGVQPYIRNEHGRQLLCGKDSSLGADNGIGMACMLALDAADIELLFTNDEEVGMIGANALSIPIQSSLLLNLDSEELGEIVLGCAGGIDIECQIMLDSKKHDSSLDLPLKEEFRYTYHLRSEGFLGGHSGIEIHKNKENAIIELMFLFSTLDVMVVSLQAGEKRNSIPVGVDCVLHSRTALQERYFTPQGACFVLEELDSREYRDKDCFHVKTFVPFFLALHNGVHVASSEGVLASLNCSMLIQEGALLKLVIMARANTDTLLHRLTAHIQSIASFTTHIEVKTSGFYSAWERSVSDSHPALLRLRSLYAQYDVSVRIAQIHAGLECGILKKRLLAQQKTPRDLEVISIGPTIHAPHSCSESLDLEDLKSFCAILENFVSCGFEGER